MLKKVDACDVPSSYSWYFKNQDRTNYGIFVSNQCVGLLGVIPRENNAAEISIAIFKEHAFKIPYMDVKNQVFLFISQMEYNKLIFRTSTRSIVSLLKRLGASFMGVLETGQGLFELNGRKAI